MTKKVEPTAMTLTNEELLIVQRSLKSNPWIPTKGYRVFRALLARFDAEVLRRGLTPDTEKVL